jgi:hypothetical protein
MNTTQTFEAALANFLALIQAADDAYMTKTFPGLCVNGRGNEFSLDMGSKNVRIVRTSVGLGDSRSVHCFVEKATGNILKAAGWKAPAKHARGNIYDADPMAGMTHYGPKYLR